MLFDKINRLICEITILFEVYPLLFRCDSPPHGRGNVLVARCSRNPETRNHHLSFSSADGACARRRVTCRSLS